MKAVYSLLVLLLFREAAGAVVRKPPAFSTPVYSDSYLPAAMQVIFHAVEQLKLQQEEAIQTVSKPTTTTQPSLSSTLSTTEVNDDRKPEATTIASLETIIVTSTEGKASEQSITSQPTSNKDPIKVDETTEKLINSAPTGETQSTNEQTKKHDFLDPKKNEENSTSHEESPEMNEEVPEVNYATPETNYESPEVVHGTQEENQEVPEVNHEESPAVSDAEIFPTKYINMEPSTVRMNSPSKTRCQLSSTQPPILNDEKIKPSIDSVVEEIYGIIKPTSSVAVEKAEAPFEERENLEDEKDETRFTLLGEKVAQVPRPSLTSYLKRAKVPPSPSLQQLANLYDALSKDARKQGFGRFAGYSDEVLGTLRSSAEGGVGPQLKKLLEKIVERNELIREDARAKTTEILRDLNDPTTVLSKDLRNLLPLRYSP